MPYKISMPHKHTVIYKNCESRVEFEVELDSRGIVLYTHSPKILMYDEKNLPLVIDRVKRWLDSRYSEVILDDSEPPVFNL